MFTSIQSQDFLVCISRHDEDGIDVPICSWNQFLKTISKQNLGSQDVKVFVIPLFFFYYCSYFISFCASKLHYQHFIFRLPRYVSIELSFMEAI